ncbi:MAG: NYN domain-containing protein [Coriobacteriia bacterium]|nr:NYN domain-containing protein [Coriobacteriia bacterium]
MEDLKIALLIDGDNISAKYLNSILDELTEVGVVNIKRIYGDWTRNEMHSWGKELLNRSITPMQQFNNVSGKNATDSALIIDAMDILYNKDVDAFAIVSSDSDFTRLASRLAESGKTVIGMGEAKTPDSFRNACTRFVSLENLHSSHGDIPTKSDLTQRGVEHVIAKTIRDNENSGKTTSLAEVGNRLRKKYPDFDVRTFGYSYLSTFIEDMPRFELTREDSLVTVKLVDPKSKKDQVNAFIVEQLRAREDQSMTMNELSNLVYENIPDFKLKDLGYSQFYKLVASIDGVTVKTIAQNEKKATLE